MIEISSFKEEIGSANGSLFVQELVPGLVYAMLEQPVDLSDLIFASGQEDNNNTQ